MINQDCIDINQVIENVYNSVLDIVQNHVPKAIFVNPKFPKWYSSDLRKFMADKKITHKKYKSTNLECDYKIFSSLRAKSKKQMKTDYEKYVHHVEANVVENPK